MTALFTLLIAACLLLGALALGTLVLVGVMRWMQRPIEPPECCVEAEE